jgi:hypothetical protein
MAFITPPDPARYVGHTVTLRASGGVTLTGTLLSHTDKRVKLMLSDGTVTTRRSAVWSVTVRLMTGAEVARLFGIKPMALRYQLRKHGVSVGKGHKYGFDPLDVDTVREWTQEGR